MNYIAGLYVNPDHSSFIAGEHPSGRVLDGWYAWDTPKFKSFMDVLNWVRGVKSPLAHVVAIVEGVDVTGNNMTRFSSDFQWPDFNLGRLPLGVRGLALLSAGHHAAPTDRLTREEERELQNAPEEAKIAFRLARSH